MLFLQGGTLPSIGKYQPLCTLLVLKAMDSKIGEKEFMVVYEANSNAIFRHIFMRVSDRELALDLTQEAFCRLWKSIVEKPELENLRAFLYKIVHNLIIDYYRKKKDVSLDRMVEEDDFEPVATSPGTAIGAEFAEFRQALLRIPDSYRDVVTMRYIDEMLPEEIADVIGITAGAVSTRITRGVEMVRKELGISTLSKT